jgi:hypothetical protein
MSASDTPRLVGWKVDQAIDGLNAEWDLRLPRLHGADAIEAEVKGTLANKCSSRIRYLCFRVEQTHLDSLLAGFEERARQKWSNWVFKPSQERGTLPSLPVTKSFLERDVQTFRRAGPLKLSESQRQELLGLLDNVLDDPFELARMSDSYSYERPSEASFVTAPTTPRKQPISAKRSAELATPTRRISAGAGAVTDDLNDEPELKDPMTKSTKRRLGSPLRVSIK